MPAGRMVDRVTAPGRFDVKMLDLVRFALIAALFAPVLIMILLFALYGPGLVVEYYDYLSTCEVLRQTGYNGRC